MRRTSKYSQHKHNTKEFMNHEKDRSIKYGRMEYTSRLSLIQLLDQTSVDVLPITHARGSKVAIISKLVTAAGS